MSPQNRWRAWLAARVVVIAAVAWAIYYTWQQGSPWAIIGFGAFVLVLLCVEALHTERRRLGRGDPRPHGEFGPQPARRASDAAAMRESAGRDDPPGAD